MSTARSLPSAAQCRQWRWSHKSKVARQLYAKREQGLGPCSYSSASSLLALPAYGYLVWVTMEPPLSSIVPPGAPGILVSK